MDHRQSASPRRAGPSPASDKLSVSSASGPSGQLTADQIVQQVKRISKPEPDRSSAISTLLANKSQIPDLPLMIWFSPGTVTALLGDVLEFYTCLVSSKIGGQKCDNVFSILVLFEMISGNSETRLPFMRANIPVYLFPILQYTLKSAEHERFTAIVIGIVVNLVKEQPPDEVAEYLVKSDFLPLCLRVLNETRGPVQVGCAFILSRVFKCPAGKKFVFDGKVTDRTIAVLCLMNEAVVNVNQAFDKEVSGWLVSAYKELLSVSEILQAAKEQVSEKIAMMHVGMNSDAPFRELVTQLKSIASRVNKR